MNFNQQGKDFDKLIQPVRLINRFVSFWPLGEEHGFLEMKLMICHRISTFVLMIIMAFAVTSDAIHNRDKMEEVTEAGLIAAAVYLVIIRLIVFATHQEEMIFIIETMKEDWSKASLEDMIVLKDKCGFSYKIAFLFICTVATAMGSFIIFPSVEIFILDGDREKLPFRGYFLTNHTISPIFEFAFVHNIASGLIGCGTIAAATSFTLVSVIHSAGKFSVLQRKLRNLKNEPYVDQLVIECVVLHQESIQFAEVLETLISPLALGQFVTSTGLLCFAGFQIISNKADKESLMKYCTFLQSAILELFIFSFSGQQLIEESEAVCESAYCNEWVGSTFTKNLQIIMMRVRNPCKITAAKFYDLSLESFSKVLSTSFSYFTVLQAVNE